MHDRGAPASSAYTLRDEIVDPDLNQGLAFPAPTAVERHFEPNPVLSGHRRSSVNKPPILSRIVAGCALSRRQELLGCVERRLDLAMSCFEPFPNVHMGKDVGFVADDRVHDALADHEIGRACGGKECVSTCRSWWSPDP